jgi:hypothetical protein
MGIPDNKWVKMCYIFLTLNAPTRIFYMHPQAPAYTYIHTCTHIHPHAPAYTHMHLHTPTCTHMHLHTPIYTHMHPYASICTPIYKFQPFRSASLPSGGKNLVRRVLMAVVASPCLNSLKHLCPLGQRYECCDVVHRHWAERLMASSPRTLVL